MITFEHISLQRGAKPLLEDASAVIHPGQKVALIGSNGAGKSSLFQALLGKLAIEAGSLNIPRSWRIAHMAQEVEATERSALEFVLDGDRELREVEAAIAAAEAANDHQPLALLHQRLDEMEGYTARVRAEKLIHGLGFSAQECLRPVSSFSGGWRIRLNLAQALMCPSDLLLLDEPTNHLDMDASLWLEEWLKSYPGTLVLVSHDRDFIDSVCEIIFHIEHHKLFSYKGNYSAFERQRAERLMQVQANYEKQQQRIVDIQGFVNRFRAKATKARQAQSRLKELERMALLEPAHVDSPFDFSFPVPDKFSDPLLSINLGVLGYAAKPVLASVNLSLHPGSRLALLGANGAGKSTLIKTLAGELALLAGELTRGEHLKTGYFSQHQLEALDMAASPILHLQRLSPAATEQQIRDFLGGFNFRGDMALSTVGRFSGGEKARLALAIIVWQKPNLLLLDEPTNHLDLDMRHALTLALQTFEGAVVLVSHDRHLVRNTADQLLLVSDGRVSAFDGDLDDYGRWLMARLRSDKAERQAAPAVSEAGEETKAPDRRQQRQQEAELRKQLAPLKKALEATERKIAKVETAIAAIEVQLADSAIYGAEQRDRLQALLLEQGTLRQQKDDLEEEWFGQQDQLEQLELSQTGA
ncbi:MAG: ABC transporter ATP-binding protein [Gammaproteobacteria bacterium BRH_c0]|nr:MAG: ABC transporter ATP-binding protein [Gammaproteobacteria bacterium BRH_c0]